jgi:hypothetical protein
MVGDGSTFIHIDTMLSSLLIDLEGKHQDEGSCNADYARGQNRDSD